MRNWQQYVRAHLGKLRTSPEREATVVAELAQQLEDTYSDAIARGLSAADALARAEAQFPDWAALTRDINAAGLPPATPDYSAGRPWTDFLRDLRYAGRQLRRAPAFAALAIGTIAFAIAGSTTVFSVADALTLRGLPYRDPAALVSVETRKADQPEIEPWTSALDFYDLRERSRTVKPLIGISPVWTMSLTGHGPAARMECLFVSGDFFSTLGVSAARGRLFTEAEDRRGSPAPVVVISHALWQSRFGGDPSVVGRQINLDGVSLTVTGILPADFRYLGDPVAGTVSQIDIWMPLAGNPLMRSMRAVRFLKTMGRLAPGTTVTDAAAEMSRLNTALAAEFPATDKGFAISVAPLADTVSARARTITLLLGATSLFILLMACANVAGLVLARALAREKEMASRVALGSTRWRLARLMIAESLVIATGGALLGIAAAFGGVRAFVAAAPPAMVHQYQLAVDGRALAFGIAVGLVCALGAGLPPALRIGRAALEPMLRAAGRGLAGTRHRLQGALVVAQVASAVILLTGASLLARSFLRMLAVDPGFDSDHVVTISTQMPPEANRPELRAATTERILAQLTSVPGVVAAGVTSRLPLGGRNLGSWIFVEGRTKAGDPQIDIEYRVASAGYFDAMRIPLKQGRTFNAADDANPAGSVLINETAARRFWPGESAIGRRIRLGPNPERQRDWITVVGVVGDVRHAGLDLAVLPEVYRPYAVNPLTAPVLAVRTAGDPAQMIRALVGRVQSVSAGIPVFDVFVMRELMARSSAQRRFVMSLVAGFALAALLLAAVGVFGLMSGVVSRRTPELGLRMALGATPGAAAGVIAASGLRLTIPGTLIGLAGAVALTRFLKSLLFEIAPLDPVALFLSVLLLLLGAGIAGAVPVWRATRVDPLEAIRREA